ncbi:MAG: hypothetical protein ACM3L8_05820 [Verrucomicrobiota bacterium]
MGVRRSVAVTDGKALMNLVTRATRWDFVRDEVESEDAGDYVDRLYGTIQFSLRNWNKYFDEDRGRSEAGLTNDLAEIRKHGYSVIAVVTPRKAPGPDGETEKFSVVLKVVKG